MRKWKKQKKLLPNKQFPIREIKRRTSGGGVVHLGNAEAHLRYFPHEIRQTEPKQKFQAPNVHFYCDKMRQIIALDFVNL